MKATVALISILILLSPCELPGIRLQRIPKPFCESEVLGNLTRLANANRVLKCVQPGAWLDLRQSAIVASEQSEDDEDLHKYLVDQLDRLDFQELSPAARIATYLSISRELYRGGKEELSFSVQAAALEEAERDDREAHFEAVFSHALETKQLDLAERLRSQNPNANSSATFRVIAERIRGGDISAFKEADYRVTNFYTADRISRALIDAGEEDKAIEFSQNLNFEANDGNDPKTVTGFVLNEIANRKFESGQTKTAKELISDAKKVAGGLYYTGYCIEVDYKRIHGTLTDDVGKFARRGAAYRSHMGDELVANFARALWQTENYTEARIAIKEIVDPENVVHANTHLAIHQIRLDQIARAKASIQLIDSPEMKFLANMHLAIKLNALGKAEESNRLKLELESQLESKTVSGCENRFWYLLGATNDFERTQKHLDGSKSATGKSKVILAVARGLAKAAIY